MPPSLNFTHWKLDHKSKVITFDHKNADKIEKYMSVAIGLHIEGST